MKTKLKNTLFKILATIASVISTGILFYLILKPCYPLYNLPLRKVPESYVGIVWPQEKITIGCYYLMVLLPPNYNRGVGTGLIGYDIFAIDFPQITNPINWEHYTKEELEHPIEDRILLYVDGKLVTNSSKRVNAVGVAGVGIHQSAGLKEGYDISWGPLLFFGKHTAKAVIETLSGDTIEYEWQFTITLW